jgi:hypothetical protein
MKRVVHVHVQACMHAFDRITMTLNWRFPSVEKMHILTPICCHELFSDFCNRSAVLHLCDVAWQLQEPGQGDQIRTMGDCLLLAVTWKLQYPTYLGYFIPWKSLRMNFNEKWVGYKLKNIFWRKMGWAIFWVIFSQTHLVTLNLEPILFIHFGHNLQAKNRQGKRRFFKRVLWSLVLSYRSEKFVHIDIYYMEYFGRNLIFVTCDWILLGINKLGIYLKNIV